MNKTSVKKHNICVIGAGYVGLVAAACFSKLGHKVVCVDNNLDKISALRKGKVPNYEPGLDLIIKNSVRKSLLYFSDSIQSGVKQAQVIFLAVGTPSRPNGEADLTALEKVAFEIAKNLDSYKVIVEKSTVPAQTGIKIKKTIQRYAKKNIEFDVASNPEFLREGSAVSDFLKPDRIVIGVESKKAEGILRSLYSGIKAPLLVTDINTAELIKHASNSFLATKISFANALSLVCEKTGADIDKVSQGMGLDQRIGKGFLKAGVGFGGSCFPKDVDAFIHLSKKVGYDFKLLTEVRNINRQQRMRFVEKIKEELWILKDKVIAILGLSFKPDTDDLREAPALYIIDMLKKEGAILRAYDPQALLKAKKILDKVELVDSPYKAIKGADCLALITEWDEFKNLNFTKIKKSMRLPLIVDGRNIYDRKHLEKLGFKYIGMGR